MKNSDVLSRCAVGALALLFLPLGCSGLGRGATTTNLAWTFEQNLVRIEATVGGRQGSFLVGTAAERTILDDSFPAVVRRGRVGINLGDRYAARAEPVRTDLQGLADGILGADAWRRRSLTIDYRRRLLVLGRTLDPIQDGVRFRFRDLPAVRVFIDGAETSALVDTANPDTVLLPSRRYGPEGRRTIALRIGETSFDAVDARVASVDEVRLGNRILANFLVTVDYPRREVSLWRDLRGGASSPQMALEIGHGVDVDRSDAVADRGRTRAIEQLLGAPISR